MGKLNNPFVGRTDGVRYGGSKYFVEDYAQCKIVQNVNPLSKTDKSAFDIVKVIEITDVVKRQDYIDQFADDVGILNVIKRVVRTGDASLIHQCDPGFIDMTNMPEDYMQAKAMYEKAMTAYNELPAGIKNGLSAEDFIKASMKDIGSNIASYVDGLLEAQKVSAAEPAPEPEKGDK